MKILAKIVAIWQRMLTKMEQDRPPSYPLVQEEWELLNAAAQSAKTSQALGLVQHRKGWGVPAASA